MIFTSKDKMFINGISSDGVGLYIDSPPSPPMPKRTYSSYTVPGRSEAFTLADDLYEDITITVRAFVFDGLYQPEAIYAFISGAKTVSFSTSEQYFYKVKRVLGIVPQYRDHDKRFLQIQFVCSPYRWAQENDYKTVTNGEGFKIKGNFYCEPVYHLEGISGDVVFTVNGVPLEIYATNGEIYLDVAARKAYQIDTDGSKIVMLDHTVGCLWDMILMPSETEENIISWEGTISTVSVKMNERWL